MYAAYAGCPPPQLSQHPHASNQLTVLLGNSLDNRCFTVTFELSNDLCQYLCTGGIKELHARELNNHHGHVRKSSDFLMNLLGNPKEEGSLNPKQSDALI